MVEVEANRGVAKTSVMALRSSRRVSQSPSPQPENWLDDEIAALLDAVSDRGAAGAEGGSAGRLRPRLARLKIDLLIAMLKLRWALKTHRLEILFYTTGVAMAVLAALVITRLNGP
jgi:hypothetical protein